MPTPGPGHRMPTPARPTPASVRRRMAPTARPTTAAAALYSHPGRGSATSRIPRAVDKAVDSPVEIPVSAGDNFGCPVDGQRILKMPRQTPCARSGGRCRNSFTTKDGYRSRGNPRTAGGPGDRHCGRVPGAVAGQAMQGGRAIGLLSAAGPSEAPASHTCGGLALLQTLPAGAVCPSAQPGALPARPPLPPALQRPNAPTPRTGQHRWRSAVAMAASLAFCCCWQPPGNRPQCATPGSPSRWSPPAATRGS